MKNRARIATIVALAVSLSYVAWLLFSPAPSETEPWISVFCLNLSYVLFIVFGIGMLRRFPQKQRLRLSWLLLVLATADIVLAECLFILRGRPVLSIAEPFYFAYYFLFFPGLLLLPFVPIRRRQKMLLILDLSIVLLASFLLLWYFLADSVAAWVAARDYPVLTNVLYPVLDLLILAAGITVIQRDVDGLHPGALLWLILGSGAAAIADVFITFGIIHDEPGFLKVSSILNVALRFFVFLSVVRQIEFLEGTAEVAASSRLKHTLQIALPYAASTVILVLLAVAFQMRDASTLKLPGVLFGTIVLVAIVLLRQHLMLQENVYLYRKAEEARKQAESATRAKAEFLAGMSHEIRAPMHGVIGVSELLSNSELTEAQRDLVRTLRISGDSLMAVINEVLDFSKIEARMVELESNPFDFRRCMDEAFAPLRMQAERKKLQLSCKVDPAVPKIVVGDRARIRAILINLLSNAIKFTDRGEVELTAGSKPGEDGIHEFHIRIRDTGIGIPLDKQERLFQPFTQVRDSASVEREGTGLGLAISKGLCELMGGEMWMESRPGQGSTFHFTFPGRAGDDHPGSGDEFRADRTLAANLALRVLIVEDNPAHQKVTGLMLGQLGYQPDLARSGREAIRMCSSQTYDLIFMDMHLPEMDGLETTRRIRQNNSGGKSPVIVALTASASQVDRERCLAAGMNDLLTKPMRIEDLQNMILRWWKGSRPYSLEFGPRGKDEAPELMQIPFLKQIPPESRAETLDQVVRAYLSDSPNRLKAIRRAAAEGNWEQIREEAHALKGASRLLGLEALADSCAALEEAETPEARTEGMARIPGMEKDLEAAAADLTALVARVRSLAHTDRML